MRNVVVFGGGAAGMLAAATASQKGCRVTLIERNEKLGKKLFITGKGRCNFTNTAKADEFFANVVRNPKFLFSAMSAFNSNDTIAMFEKLGVRHKVERGGRVFPASDKSSDCLKALEKHLAQTGVTIRLNEKVSQIETEDKGVCGVVTDKGKYDADAVIMATGGASYASTGSDGSAFKMINQTHSVSALYPALIPMETAESWPKELAGLTLKNVVLTAYCDGKRIFQELGEMLFTHFGISGPLVLSASSYLDASKHTSISIDLKPGLTDQQLTARVQRDFDANPKKQYRNSLFELLPASLAPIVVDLSGVYGEKPACEISRAERQRLVETLKDLKLDIVSVRPINEAIITRGGVSVRDINPASMQSKKIKGLFFAGEMIDVDALTGGFNLQIAFSTGYLAGISAAAEGLW